jgi:hypothetical protein
MGNAIRCDSSNKEKEFCGFSWFNIAVGTLLSVLVGIVYYILIKKNPKPAIFYIITGVLFLMSGIWGLIVSTKVKDCETCKECPKCETAPTTTTAK